MGRSAFIGGLVVLAIFAVKTAAWAHGTEQHHSKPTSKATAAAIDQDAFAGQPFPVDLGGPFELTDHTGARRKLSDFEGQNPVLFFGFARCESICPVALRHMLEAVDLLGEAGADLQPILITIDPENETPDVLADEVPKLHPRLLGLTGSSEEIAAVRKLFRVEAELVGTNIKGNPVFAHGSFVYLMDKDGSFLTLLPPILDGPTMAEKIRPYL